MAAQASQAALAGNDPGGQVRQGPAGQVREDLLDLGVVAVLGLGLGQDERGVGEDRVVAPHGEQFILAAGGLAVAVFDPADDQPGGDGPVRRGERRVPHLGHLGVGDPAG